MQIYFVYVDCFECPFCLRRFISFTHLYNICLHVPFPSINKHTIPLSKTYTKLQHKFWGTKNIYQNNVPLQYKSISNKEEFTFILKIQKKVHYFLSYT